MRTRKLTIKGVSSLSFGLEWIKTQIDMIPSQNDEYRQVPGLDGAYHVPKEMGNKEMRIQFVCENKSLSEWEDRRDRIVAWLTSKEEHVILDSNKPGRFYIGKLTSFEQPEGDYRIKHFWVVFKIHPFRYTDSVTVPPVTSGNMVVNYTDLYETPYVFSMVATAAKNGFEFTLNGHKLSYDGPIAAGDSITIDIRDLMVYVNGRLKVMEVNGDFSFLQPGENILAMTVPGVRNLTYVGRSL